MEPQLADSVGYGLWGLWDRDTHVLWCPAPQEALGGPGRAGSQGRAHHLLFTGDGESCATECRGGQVCQEERGGRGVLPGKGKGLPGGAAQGSSEAQGVSSVRRGAVGRAVPTAVVAFGSEKARSHVWTDKVQEGDGGKRQEPRGHRAIRRKDW